MREITTENGMSLTVRPADFKDAMALKNAIMKQVAKDGVDLNIDVKSLQNMDNLGSLISTVAGIDSSEEVQKALFSCLTQCTYNGFRITENLFDDHVDTRADYYEIMIECAKPSVS